MTRSGESFQAAAPHRYLRLHFQIKPQSGTTAELSVPVLRRVLGRALIEGYCPPGEPLCQPKRSGKGRPPEPGELCALAASCPYGVLFAASASPRPPYTLYLHRPPGAGASLFLEVTLFGPGWRMYPWVGRALEVALRRGVGRDRRKWEVQSVFQVTGPRSRRRLCGRELKAIPVDLQPTALPLPGSVAKPSRSGQPVRIDLLSPTRLVDGSRLLRDGTPVPFRLLVARTLDRFHGLFDGPGGRGALPGGLGELAKEAERVPLLEDRTRRHALHDYSARSGREIRLDGRVGRLLYGAEAARFLPVLRMAEILHIGKNPASGCGRVRVESVSVG